MDYSDEQEIVENKARGQSKPWLDMIAEAEKAFQTYQDKADSVDQKYGSLKILAEGIGDREFQIFWANLEVLRPTIYQRPPRPVVMPRHRDGKEIVRKASELIERVLEMDIEADDLHDTLLLVRDDLALSARGVLWVLDDGRCIHVDRKDFLHEPARKWSEVGWVARRAYLTLEQGRNRFGDAFLDAKREQVSHDPANSGSPVGDEYRTSEKKAQVWEIWSRVENKVVWVTEGIDEALDERPPLFDVKGFFPCPKPAYGTVERGTLKPIPDYVYYRDQCDEINELTARISSLSESLRLKGFYASGTSEIGEAIEAAMRQTDNKAILVPVSNFAAVGGQALKDAIVWLPVDQVATVITQLVALRRQLIEDVYEITGLSDIMRGATDASETATAQNLKAQYGSVRVRERQNEMVRIALDILRIKAEIYAENVPGSQLLKMAGMEMMTMQQVQQMMMQAQQQAMMAQQQGQQQGQQPPPPPDMSKIVTIEQVDQLLKSDRLRPFLMQIESDSTIAADEQAEKNSRIEFVTAIGSFIQQAGAMVAQQPETAPFAGELIKFAAGGFRAGRDLGGAIEEFVDVVKSKAQAATQQQGPSPEEMAMQAEMQAKQQEMQMRMQEMQANAQLKQQEIQLRGQEMQAKATLEAERMRMDMAMKNLELQLKARELGLKVDEQELAERKTEVDALMRINEMDMEREQERPVKLGNDDA